MITLLVEIHDNSPHGVLFHWYVGEKEAVLGCRMAEVLFLLFQSKFSCLDWNPFPFFSLWWLIIYNDSPLIISIHECSYIEKSVIPVTLTPDLRILYKKVLLESQGVSVQLPFNFTLRRDSVGVSGKEKEHDSSFAKLFAITLELSPSEVYAFILSGVSIQIRSFIVFAVLYPSETNKPSLPWTKRYIRQLWY